jgi:hypothetical protein
LTMKIDRVRNEVYNLNRRLGPCLVEALNGNTVPGKG